MLTRLTYQTIALPCGRSIKVAPSPTMSVLIGSPSMAHVFGVHEFMQESRETESFGLPRAPIVCQNLMHNLGAYSYMCITLLWSVLPGICNLPTTFQVRPYTMGAASSAALGVVSPPEGQSIVNLSLPFHFTTSRELLLFYVSCELTLANLLV